MTARPLTTDDARHIARARLAIGFLILAMCVVIAIVAGSLLGAAR